MVAGFVSLILEKMPDMIDDIQLPLSEDNAAEERNADSLTFSREAAVVPDEGIAAASPFITAQPEEEPEDREKVEDVVTSEKTERPEQSENMSSSAPLPEAANERTERSASTAAFIPGVASPSPETQVADSESPEAESDMGNYWKRVLTGNPATVPTDIRAMAGADDDALDTEEQDYRLLGAINRSWAVDHLNMSKESVQDGWRDCRARLAEELGVADDEHEVFMGLSARQEDKPRREAAKRIFRTAYLSGLKGEKTFDIRPLQEGLEAEDCEASDALGRDAFRRGFEMRQKWLPLATRLAHGTDVFMAPEEDFLSAPRIFAAAPDLVRAVDEVADLGKDDSETVLFLAAQMAERERGRERDGESEGMGSRLVRAVRRGAGSVGMGLAQIVNHMGIVAVDEVGKALGDSGQSLMKAAEAWERRSTVLRRLREITQQEIAPLYPADAERRAERYLIDAAEATPAALLAFCGGAGFAALAASGMGESVAAARSMNPQGDHELQLAAGIMGGAVQGAIYMGMGRLGGRMLEQSVSNFMKSRGAGVGAFSMNALKSAGSAAMHGAELIAAGKAAAAAEMGTQELAARLSGTASNIDWKSFGDNLTDIEANLRESAAILPFLLIGSGRVALRHFRSPHAVLGDGLALRDWGVDEQTRRRIIQEKDIDVQSTMLRDALRNSRRWSAPGFMPEIVRAMSLFNGDYFKGFRDIECVRDFLNLPAERTLLENKVIEERDATKPQVTKLDGHIESRCVRQDLRRKARFAEVMQFWDKLYQQSHIAEYTPRRHFFELPQEGFDTAGDDRVAFYTDITDGNIPTIPYRMRNVGYYNPRGEAERRALMRDRTQECLDLSYQFVMSTFSVDSLMATPFPVSRIAHHLELTRNNVVGQMARAVLDMAMGMKPAESMKKLSHDLAWMCVRRSYRGSSPEWMKETNFREFYHLDEHIPHYSDVTDAHHQDFKNILRVISGLNACARTLTRLLPMTSDFHAALGRGMSPLQAYHHLLVRELGFNPDKVVGYPKEAIEESATPGNMERFCEDNRKSFELAKRLSGSELEQCVGDDGKTYWRAARPDSGYTRWHVEPQHAINELSVSISPYFAKMGRGIQRWILRSGAKGAFDFDTIPRATYEEYSGFDQLCAMATQDLGDFWYRSVARTQPGFRPTRLRAMLTGKNAATLLRARTEKAENAEAGVDISVDHLSQLSPISMMDARFRVFWERALHSGLLTAQEAGQFLMQRGYLTPERYRKIIDRSRPLPYPRNPHIPLRLTPPPDIAGMNSDMAAEMSRFHSLYSIAHIGQQNLPESVKAWFRMVPFCPDMPVEDYRTDLRIRSGHRKRRAISWANRYSAMAIKQLAPEVETMRRQIAEHPLPEGKISELFRRASGEPIEQRCEQSWCYHYAGPGVFSGTPQKDWELMLRPMHSWKLFTEEEKQDIRTRLESFCRSDPSQEAIDALGRGEDVDYFECSLRQLDRVLQRFPELHHYAYAAGGGKSGVIRLLQLKDDPPERHPDAEPETRPISLRWLGDFKGSYSVQALPKMPDVFASDSEALSSLRFLDAMRRVTMRRPFAMENGIWWNRKHYGGQFGAHPKGLEDWQSEEPLEPLFTILNNIRKTCREQDSETLNICGVELRGSHWSRQDFEELAAVSIYRWPENRARTYRLMPGYPDSTNVRARTPYVVACHCGAYMDGNLVIRRIDDLQKSFCPLEYFTPSRLRYHSNVNLNQWRHMALDAVLDAISNQPNYMETIPSPTNGIIGMGELLLRLCEDTGFCRTITPDAPRELTRWQAHIVNIAGAMLDCMQPGATAKAGKRLHTALAPLQKNPELRHEVINTLLRSCDQISEDTRIHNNILRQLEWNWDDIDENNESPEQTETNEKLAPAV